jgi:hypothetical protein
MVERVEAKGMANKSGSTKIRKCTANGELM